MCMCILFIVCDMVMWRNMAGFACSFSIFLKLCIEFFIAGKSFIEMYVYSTVGWLLLCVCVFPEVQRLL